MNPLFSPKLVGRSILLLAFAIFFGCEKKPKVAPLTEHPVRPVSTLQTNETMRLGDAIDRFERAPSRELAADVHDAFGDLDGEIAELQHRLGKVSGNDQRETGSKLDALATYRQQEAIRFTQLQAAAPHTVGRPEPSKPDVRQAADELGRSIERGAREIGDTVRDIVR